LAAQSPQGHLGDRGASIQATNCRGRSPAAQEPTPQPAPPGHPHRTRAHRPL